VDILGTVVSQVHQDIRAPPGIQDSLDLLDTADILDSLDSVVTPGIQDLG